MSKKTPVVLLGIVISIYLMGTIYNHFNMLEELENKLYNEEKNNRLIRQELESELAILQKEKSECEAKSEKLERELKLKNEENEKLKSKNTSRGRKPKISYLNFEATAYDLSVESCGKSVGDSGYGITATGRNLKGLTREQAMVVAVDPRVIPLGSKLEIIFPKPYTHFSGIYTADDTGGAIKGKIIDLYMGENMYDEMIKFGRKNVKVRVIK